jgi:hypothetical protein
MVTPLTRTPIWFRAGVILLLMVIALLFGLIVAGVSNPIVTFTLAASGLFSSLIRFFAWVWEQS